MKRTSVVITGLNDIFNKKVASLLCDKLAMFLLEVTDLMEFELAEKDDIIAKCGIEYYELQESKLFSSLGEYENTVILLEYDHFTFDNHYKIFSNAHTFYLRFTKEKLKKYDVNIIQQIAFEERDNVLKSHCITLNVGGNEQDAVTQIVTALKEVAL